MGQIDQRAEVREFLSTRRARITPERAGLPAYGGKRRVKGLRREEVAMLAGVSVDYYVRMERGNLSGASESVLDSLARALQLDEAEREHLFTLARTAGPGSRGRGAPPTSVRPTVRHLLDAISDAPAWVRNARHDVLAMNQLGRALYSPVLEDPRRPANTTRFVYLNPAAKDFFVDWDEIANDGAAMLRLEAGRNPHDKALIELVGELSTQSEVFRQRLGLPRRAVPPQRPEEAAAPGGWPARPGLRVDGPGLRRRPGAQRVHRRTGQPRRRRLEDAGELGGHAGPRRGFLRGGRVTA
jgi:transcriptional regulator with XRE-family HTH domain